METDTFIYIWTLLNPQGEFKRREHACRRLWASYDPAKQRDIYNTIRDKQRRGEFVNQNPYFAIEDNAIGLAARLSIMSAPKNYNGSREFDAMVATGTLVTARYNGETGVYTEEDARRHHMTIINHMRP